MIDWIRGTWKEGDRVRYHQGHGHKECHEKCFAGLYWYSGLGSGTFFRPDGTMLQGCTMQEAHDEARRFGIKAMFIDSFIASTFRSVMG